MSEVRAFLKQATDSVAALRESQKIASAAGEGQAGQIATLGDSLAAAKLAKDQLARQIDSLAARQASMESQLKGTTDSLIVVTARQRQSVATSRQQGAEIIQLADSLAGTLQSLRNLESRHDSLSALKESTALKLASSNDSLNTIGILYKSAASITRQQIIKLSSLRDSLARSTSAGREMEAHFDSLLALQETLVTQLGQAVDSIAAQVGAMANLRGEIQHRDSLLTGVRDSLSTSVGREADLQARHDALTALKDSLAASLDQAGRELATADSLEQALTTEINVLEVVFQDFENRLASGEEPLSGIYDQVKTAVIAVEQAAIDAELDTRYLAHLKDLVEYKGKSRGMGRLLAGGGRGVLTRYKMEEFHHYLSWAALRGRTPEALNLLAAEYYGQKDEVRGALTYLKTVFLYAETPAGEFATGRLDEAVKEGSEIARLYRDVALNPDSMKVVNKVVYRYYHYLGNIRRLQHVDARRYFLDEAYQFLSFYPDVYRVDLLHAWTADTYHALGEYHTEILTYLKTRSLFPDSKHRAQITFSLAEVTATDLKNHQLGAERYALFLEEFSEHALAPQALLAQARLYVSNLKQPAKAGELYRRLADSYAGHELAPVALLSYAELLQGKLKLPAEALTVYEELLSDYGDDQRVGVRALEGLAAVSQKSRQYEKAAGYYLELFKRFPGAADQVVAGLMEAADIYEAKLKNPGEALQSLQLVLSNYPQHKKIKAVQKRVQKLKKKSG
ncbi:MAG: tetratricopeptide repeat protein [Candidatus Marinimicrobia bacterium]|nr:tetratricopeptide repeat protein [Candidatus Neomarinimicrobiota bacterium]